MQLLLSALLVGSALAAGPAADISSAIEKSETCAARFGRVDCGYFGITEDECKRASCCWVPTEEANTPWCFKASASTAYSVVESNRRGRGLDLVLKLQNGIAQYGADFEHVSVTVDFLERGVVRVKMTNGDSPRFEIPSYAVGTHENWNSRISAAYEHGSDSVFEGSDARMVFDEEEWDFTVTYEASPFAITVTRKADGEVVFSTLNDYGVVLQDQYLELTTKVAPDASLYGLPEHIAPFKLSNHHTYSMFAIDLPTPADMNLYSTGPVMYELRHKEQQGSAHAVYLRNVNGVEVSTSSGLVQWRAIGGVLDFIVAVGDKPVAVTQQLQSVIGRPTMPPFWSLGFQVCRYGFRDLDEVQEVVRDMRRHELPFDVVYFDIDYMHKKEVFTFDEHTFPQRRTLDWVKNELHDGGQRLVVILDPGLHNRTGYESFDRGFQQDLFLKSAHRPSDDGRGNFIGTVWPGFAVFPDWSSPEARDFWQQEIRHFVPKADIDGLWIDMNEAANFCNGECDVNYPPPVPPDSEIAEATELAADVLTANWKDAWSSRIKRGDAFNPNTPPFPLLNAGSRSRKLQYKNIAMDARYSSGDLEYDMHNMFGHLEGISTHEALKQTRRERPFVVSRSTIPGSGQYVAHWLGDNDSTWHSMRESIQGLLVFNLIGVPQVGADICGFGGVADEELCARWQALGHFYTFSRNHNAIHQPAQWPYLWPLVADVTRRVGHLKYSLLDYYNSLFFRAHSVGGTVLDPLWMHFADERDTWLVEDQFMVGASLLVSPVMHQGATELSPYFPMGVWYDLMAPGNAVLGRGHRRTLDARLPQNPIHVHVRGGSILPRRDTSGIMNTDDLLRKPLQWHVFVGDDGSASGELFADDGLAIDAGKEALRATARATLKSRSLQFVSRVVQNNLGKTIPLEAVVLSFIDTTEELCDTDRITVRVNGEVSPVDVTAEWFVHTNICVLDVRDINVTANSDLVLDLLWE